VYKVIEKLHWSCVVVTERRNSVVWSVQLHVAAILEEALYRSVALESLNLVFCPKAESLEFADDSFGAVLARVR
jgi:hypothetical protein